MEFQLQEKMKKALKTMAFKASMVEISGIKPPTS